MQTALHDPYAGMTPTQLKAYEQRRKFRSTLAAKAAAVAGGVKLEDRRPFCNRPKSIRIDIHEDPEVDTSIPIYEVECESIFLGSVSAMRIPQRRVQVGGIQVRDIQRIVARDYGVTRADLLSKRRDKGVTMPRQIAMYLAQQMTLKSWPEIGRQFNKVDHSSPWHAGKKIERLLKNDPALAARIEDLKFKIRGESA